MLGLRAAFLEEAWGRLQATWAVLVHCLALCPMWHQSDRPEPTDWTGEPAAVLLAPHWPRLACRDACVPPEGMERARGVRS